MTSLGMGLREVNTLPLNFVLNEMMPYLAENPPAHILLRGFVGYKYEPKSGGEPTAVESQFMAQMPVRPFTSLPPALQQLLKERPN